MLAYPDTTYLGPSQECEFDLGGVSESRFEADGSRAGRFPIRATASSGTFADAPMCDGGLGNDC